MLLVRCGRSDQQAFAELYDRTCARVFGLVLRVVCDRGYAEDITQEAYVQGWRTAASFDPGKGSGSRHHQKHSTRCCDDRLNPRREPGVGRPSKSVDRHGFPTHGKCRSQYVSGSVVQTARG
ncbi:sigma factor [Nocardia sp. CS682]|uniref:sigma factor n=1 Tax=Nocardia sp. CS682 TaxID=1047172 RepID=UPI001074C60A|nr:hypothetical protein DMB37_36095 [Nocardia sp. CS682]